MKSLIPSVGFEEYFLSSFRGSFSQTFLKLIRANHSNNSKYLHILHKIYNSNKFIFPSSSALNKFHSPLHHRNHSFETDFRSSTLFAEHENPLSLSAELCLTSLSSDSGILTAKLSDISNSGEFDKSPIRQQMESYGGKCFGGDADEIGGSNKTENVGDEKKSGLSRSDSVRARANMFQAMEEQRKLNTDNGQRIISKCKKLKVLIFR